MSRLRDILYFIASLVALVVMEGCNTSGCLENRSSMPLAGFYTSTSQQQIALDSIEITGLGMDNPYIKVGNKISSTYLPLRSTMESTTWEFAYKWHYMMGGTLCDTITFDYTSMPYFVSDECGVIYRYHITRLTYTRHLIESIEITDSLISNTDVERIKIYFRSDE